MAIKSTYFGLQKFQRSMEIQEQARQLVENSGSPVVLGFEYYPVITIGKNAELTAELLRSQADLSRQGFQFAETDRGGQATLHSPGQLVIYPLVPLRKRGLSVKNFVRILENSTIEWLKKYGISSEHREDAGVFTEKGKIAFIGIRVSNGISKHGISININNDLGLFQGIRPCGMSQRPLDSLYENQVSIDLADAFQSWNLYFSHELMARTDSLDFYC